MKTRFYRYRRSLFVSWRQFLSQLWAALKNPILLIFTVLGNIVLFGCSSVFYFAENGANPGLHSYGDAVWWGFVTMTTVGYGDIVPLTITGRFCAAALIFFGGIFFLSFVAVFSRAFIELEFHELEEEMHRIERSVKQSQDDSSRS